MVDNSIFNIGLVGDVMLGRLFYNDTIDDSPWDKALIRFIKNDINILTGNLETTITKSDTKSQGRMYNFKMNPMHSRWLSDIGFKYLSLANNHTLDYEAIGLGDTMRNLTREGIIHTGAGARRNDAFKMKSIKIKEVTIGFMSVSDHPKVYKSSDDMEGIALIQMDDEFERRRYLELVINERAKVDILIVYVHWYTNWVRIIPEWMKQFGRELIDSGVKIVAGTSAHHILELEQYNEGLILYGLGDFIDDYTINPDFRNDLGVIINVTFDGPDMVGISLVPTRIENKKVLGVSEKEPDWDLVTKKLIGL